MNMDTYWQRIARQKAKTDWQDDPEAFLKGDTNKYNIHIDSYMWEAYEEERQLILTEMRRSKS